MPKERPTKRPADVQEVERDDAIIGAAIKWSLLALACLLLIVGGVWVLLNSPAPARPDQQTGVAIAVKREAPPVELPQTPFVDITKEAGLHFVHQNGATGDKLLPETMGGGCAFFDFDNDGDQDLLLVNSESWTKDSDSATTTSALYRNDGQGVFEEVTAGSGLDVSFYGMGVAVGDYDNDGLPDLFFTAVGPNHLFHNEGDGKFVEVTRAAGVAGDQAAWGASCGWFDFDNDGDLDLAVCNYLQWTREEDAGQNFKLTGGGRAYGRPQNFEGAFAYLYRNEGNGQFSDISAAAGVQVRNPATGVPLAKSLGITFHDFNYDGWLDIVIANDTVQNQLFENLKNGSFKEVGAVAGIAFDSSGSARGAMGIDAAHFRNDDAVGVAIGNFSNEMTALYVSYNDEMQFTDESISSGLGPNTRLELTFGVFYFDYDLDGRLDLFAANGHLEEDINRVQASQFYEQSPQLFWNCGPEYATEFLPTSAELCGPDLFKPIVGRGACYADIDADGDLDLLIASVGRSPRLLRNDQHLNHHWLRLKLIGRSANRDAIGADVTVRYSDEGGGGVLRRQVMPTRSYLSQVELPVTFGLGEQSQVESIEITWPDGARQTVEGLALNQMHVVEQPATGD